jgi:glutamate dehydrogenase/leucine dehydrogenase
MDDTLFRFADDLGPRKLVHVWEPRCGLRAVVAVDNVACGPAIGGVRMAPDVSAEEAFRLARAMTLKNAAAGLPHGGGKAVIFADPRQPARDKERLLRAFAAAIRTLVEYIPGPDMGTDETCMAWLHDEIGRAVGLPPAFGGIPLDVIGATGLGLAAAAEVAQDFAGIRLDGARVALQGFGAVGKHAARLLAEKGARVVAVADSKGTVHDPAGLDVASLLALRDAGRSVVDHPRGEKRAAEAVIDVPCDVWIPAARPDAITQANVGRLSARLILEGANIPITPEAEAALHARGVVVVPDFIANAGGVICASVEYHGGTERQALDVIRERVAANTRSVLESSRRSGAPPREAALELALARVRAAAALRRF